MTNKTITEIINQISDSLLQQSESIFNNPGNIGDSREKAVIAFLDKVMPGCYGFSSGEIIDIKGNRSQQSDIIIYDKLHSPFFTDGSGKIIAPVDSIYGAIEVKSIIDTKALDQVKSQVETLSGMDRQHSSGYQIHPYLSLNSSGSIRISTSQNDLLFCLFGYKSNLSIKTIADYTNTTKIGAHLILVFNQFLIVSNNYHGLLKLEPKSINDTYIIEGPKSTAVFILLLQYFLSTNHLVGINLISLIKDVFKSSDISILESLS